MKGFIEVNDGNDKTLININHITTVKHNIIYTDEMIPCQTDYMNYACSETYEEIKEKIKEALKD